MAKPGIGSGKYQSSSPVLRSSGLDSLPRIQGDNECCDATEAKRGELLNTPGVRLTAEHNRLQLLIALASLHRLLIKETGIHTEHW